MTDKLIMIGSQFMHIFICMHMMYMQITIYSGQVYNRLLIIFLYSLAIGMAAAIYSF